MGVSVIATAVVHTACKVSTMASFIGKMGVAHSDMGA